MPSRRKLTIRGAGRDFLAALRAGGDSPFSSYPSATCAEPPQPAAAPTIADLLGFARTTDDCKRFLRDVCGITISTKVDEFTEYVFSRLIAGEIVRVAGRANRGGGKTLIASGIETAALFLLGFDGCNLGGSLEQAMAAYGYIQAWCYDDRLAPHLVDTTMRRTTTTECRWIRVLAASPKSIRSKHAGGDPKAPPHGGLLVIDEEAEIEEDLVEAAFSLVNTAHPSAILRISTQHKNIGSFKKLMDDPAQYGYTAFTWDSFDCARKCVIDCAACPVPEFAQDTYGVDRSGARVLKHRAFCAGRAHTSSGWIAIEELFQQWKDSRGKMHRWLVDVMGRAASRETMIYPAELIDEATIVDDVVIRPKLWQPLMKSVGIDWGYTGQTAATFLFRGPKKHTFRHACMTWTHELERVIVDELAAVIKRDNVQTVIGDAAGAFQNAALNDALQRIGAGVQVTPFNFGVDKETGISNVRALLENGMLHFLASFGGQPTPNHAEFIRTLKGYHRDAHGKPVKSEDHIPDSLTMAAWAFPQAHFDPQPNIWMSVSTPAGVSLVRAQDAGAVPDAPNIPSRKDDANHGVLRGPYTPSELDD